MVLFDQNSSVSMMMFEGCGHMTETSLISQEQFVGVAKRDRFGLLIGLWLREEPEQEVVSHGDGSIQPGGSMMGRGGYAAAAASTALSVAIQPVGGIVGRNEGRGQWIEGGA